MRSFVEAEEKYLDQITKMGMDLWPDNNSDELKEEFAQLLSSHKDKVLLCLNDDEPIAFIHVSLRIDYVEGSRSSPTGFVEGIYVKPEYRRKGISNKLIAEGERWLKTKGCKQIGSDIELTNDTSYHFHTSVGFIETNRLIAFIKDIN
ncbi:GNAT family N-acetyltransferase [Fictibacillus sp. UD]|uniref:aminoglycoside 6'-N-acetyltransferase n=1 Tax=Fictibacillus sp. UD TaxID=3038777 RepID=UPI003746D220